MFAADNSADPADGDHCNVIVYKGKISGPVQIP